MFCLDFANRAAALDGYADLVALALQAGTVSSAESKRLLAEARRRPDDARAVVDHARDLGAALRRTFSAVAADRSPAPADLAHVQRAYADAAPHARLLPAATALRWGWSGDLVLDRVLWPVTRCAVDLLTSPELQRVRACADVSCGRLLYDESRNRTRRWCSSAECGNRARVRSYHQRRRAQA